VAGDTTVRQTVSNRFDFATIQSAEEVARSVTETKRPDADPTAVGVTVALAYLGYTHDDFRVTPEGVVYEGEPQALADDSALADATDQLTRDVTVAEEWISHHLIEGET